MYIHEAIKARTPNMPFVTREKWLDTFGYAVKLLPTNSPDGMILKSHAMREPRRGWQPTAEDLISDDWIVTN